MGLERGFYSIASTSVYNGIATKLEDTLSMENTQLAGLWGFDAQFRYTCRRLN